MFTLTRDLVTLEFSVLVDLNDTVRITCVQTYIYIYIYTFCLNVKYTGRIKEGHQSTIIHPLNQLKNILHFLPNQISVIINKIL